MPVQSCQNMNFNRLHQKFLISRRRRYKYMKSRNTVRSLSEKNDCRTSKKKAKNSNRHGTGNINKANW